MNTDNLIDNIIYGARVTQIDLASEPANDPHIGDKPVTVTYETNMGQKKSIQSQFVILAIPYTSQRSIVKNKNFVPKQEMAIREVRYVEVTKVLLQYKRRWWEGVFDDAGQGTDGGLVSDLPIRYTMFPKKDKNHQFDPPNERGVIMAAYTFEQDATLLGAMTPARQIQIAAENLQRIFADRLKAISPDLNSLDLLEVGASQVFPADELAGGSAFCYFGPTQKQDYLETMCDSDWKYPDPVNGTARCFFAGEQASYTHGWIQGAFEAGLRCVNQVWQAAVAIPQ